MAKLAVVLLLVAALVGSAVAAKKPAKLRGDLTAYNMAKGGEFYLCVTDAGLMAPRAWLLHQHSCLQAIAGRWKPLRAPSSLIAPMSKQRALCRKRTDASKVCCR